MVAAVNAKAKATDRVRPFLETQPHPWVPSELKSADKDPAVDPAFVEDVGSGLGLATGQIVDVQGAIASAAITKAAKMVAGREEPARWWRSMTPMVHARAVAGVSAPGDWLSPRPTWPTELGSRRATARGGPCLATRPCASRWGRRRRPRTSTGDHARRLHRGERRQAIAGEGSARGLGAGSPGLPGRRTPGPPFWPLGKETSQVAGVVAEEVNGWAEPRPVRGILTVWSESLSAAGDYAFPCAGQRQRRQRAEVNGGVRPGGVGGAGMRGQSCSTSSWPTPWGHAPTALQHRGLPCSAPRAPFPPATDLDGSTRIFPDLQSNERM